jgi:hypothetical protein
VTGQPRSRQPPLDVSAERWAGVLGTVTWPDGIDLAPEPLCEQALAHPLVAA